ncbi:hypothetical protein ACFLU1_02220 [Chloroflexota bacterium]
MSNIKGTIDTAKVSKVPEGYNDFISQVDMVTINVLSADMKQSGCDELPEKYRIGIKMKARFENNEEESKFDIIQTYALTMRDIKQKKNVAKLSVTFCVVYSSDIPMTEKYMDVFVNTNLPLNTWPYFREFSHNNLARMGFIDVVAPVVRSMANWRP